MYIVRFCGGLGNQMFQYAFLRALQAAYPDVDVRADLTAYLDCDFHWGYELERIFGIRVKQASRKDIMRLSNYIPSLGRGRIFRIQSRINRKMHKLIGQKKKDSVIDHFLNKDPAILFELPKDKEFYFDGYWMGEPFYKNVRENVFDTFLWNESLYEEFSPLLKEFSSCESVAVHVRRGDFVGTDFDILPKNYYPDAIRYVREKYPNAKFYFFSDDTDYCEKEFASIEKKIINGNTGMNSYKDMFLMSQCKHNIIVNSTFSYWGGELNKNPWKIIVSPDCYPGTYFVHKEWYVIR